MRYAEGLSRKRSIILYPLSLIFGLVTGIRNFLYNSGVLKSHEFKLPVICIGNITVGGTGKTPHCEYLIGLLKESFRVALLSRGYKRKSSGFIIVKPGMPVSETGDEPLQISIMHSDITVAADRNRVNGINRIISEKPDTELIILDDGFQHRRVTPGLSILLTDYSRLMIYDYLLPYGELRESISNMYRADVIVVTKSPLNITPIERRLIVKNMNKAAYQNLFFTGYEYGEPLPVFGEVRTSGKSPVREKREKCGIVLVTGIASPDPLREYLNGFASEIIHLQYPDHHSYSDADIIRINEAFNNLVTEIKFVVTTSKDAVRFREFSNIADSLKSSFFYIPVRVVFLNDEKTEFDNLIFEYVRKNKRNSRISEIKGL